HGLAGGRADPEHRGRGLFGRFYHRFERFFEHQTRRYGRLLAWSLAHRLLVLLVVGLLFVGSISLAFGIGREFFPQVDAGQITLYVRAPSKLRLDATTERVADVEHFVQATIPPAEREMIVSEIGLDPDW